MQLSKLIVRDFEDRVGSLTLAVSALLRWAGADVQYRSLNAAMALSLRTTAVRGKTCLGWWSTHASDRFLPQAADMFGIRIRELHPPEASTGLADRSQFAQHFEASYAPLIRRALENQQPVLAWQGWPDARASLWGIITGISDDGVGFSGTTMWSRGQRVPLVLPPVQVYVVEDIHPKRPAADELLAQAVLRFHRTMHDRSLDESIVMGSTAYEEWFQRLESDEVCPTCGDRGGRCHVQHARCVTSDRSSAIRFFLHYRDGADKEVRNCLDALLVQCRGVIDVLTASRDDAAVDALVDTSQGRRALRLAVRAAQSFDAATADAIDHLAGLIG
jgi:hypothetical protein